MFRLAHEFAQRGESVLTTSTKIFVPSKDQSSRVIISSSVVDIIKQSRKCVSNNPHLTAGRQHFPLQGKLTGFNSENIEALWRSKVFRWIIVEADGAAHKSLKAPASHEPVIPVCSHWLIAVIGLDVIYKPLLEQWVFRSQTYSELTGLPLCEAITERSIADILIHKNGVMKGCPAHTFRYAFLNKADMPDRRISGYNIINFFT